IAIAAIPVVNPRPQSNKSFSGPARISVLIPSRCALKVGPPAVPSRITLRLESPFGVANPCDSTLARSETNNRKLSSMDLVFILPPKRSIRFWAGPAAIGFGIGTPRETALWAEDGVVVERRQYTGQSPGTMLG